MAIDLRSREGDLSVAQRGRSVGLSLATVGLAIIGVVLIAGLVAGGSVDEPGAGDRIQAIVAWTFGLTVIGFATLKIGIATVLGTILAWAWRRAAAVRGALPLLVPHGSPAVAGGPAAAGGRVIVTEEPPRALLVHRMARVLWAPMLVMGVMGVAVGFVLSLVWANRIGAGSVTAVAAWTQGLQFLGEGMVLAGISFLLGTILYALRTSGGEIQRSLGVAVHTLRMPAAAKAFIALMAIGMMVEVAQFVGYVAVAAGSVDPVASFAWLGPLREAGLGLLLSAIVLALATIATALRFQFDRVGELISTSGKEG